MNHQFLNTVNARNIVRAFVVCLCAGVTPSQSETVVLVRDGKPAATIVVARRDGHPSDRAGDEQLRKAAEELALYIRRLSGVEIPIRMDGARIDGAGLILGVFGQHPSHGRIASRLEIFYDLFYLDDVGGSQPRERLQHRLKADWRYRSVTMRMSAQLSDETQGTADRQDERIRIDVTRSF